MLPGLRFVLAASLLAASLLVFGMGAIALLRASHQQVANLSVQAAPEPVFAQAPQTVPSLSVLRVEAASADAAAIAADAGRLAALTSAVREPEPAPLALLPPQVAPILAEPQPALPETRSEAAPASDSAKADDHQPAAAPEANTAVATLPETNPPQPSVPATSPPQADITGSTPKPAPIEPAPIEPASTEPATPQIAHTPVPQARPESANKVAALTPGVTEAPKTAAVRKARQFRRRPVRQPRIRIAPAASSNPLSALFGGGN